MSRSHPRSAPLAVAALAVTLLAQAPVEPPPAPPPAAGGQDLVLVLEGQQRPLLRLAFPAFAAVGLSAPAAAAARELEETLRADLDDARIFEIQGASDLAVLALTGDAARDNEQFRALGNEVLLLGDVREEGDRLVLEGRLLDLKSGQSILGKRYRSEFALARRVAHTFADEIVLYFTSKRGIALTTLAFYSDRDGHKEVYLMDADGRNQRRITGHKSISMSPAWHPAGASLAYVSFFDGGPSLYLVELAGGRKRPLVADGRLNISPSFSPDGRRLAFARSVEGNTEIFVADADGGNPRRLTHSPGIDTNPAWSPSGRELAFTSNRAGGPHLYVMDAEGANLRRLSFEGENNDGATWRPDGTQIAYARRSGNAFDVATTDVVTLETRLLTNGPGSSESPSFSPDGRKIAFARKLGRETQVWIMGVDGSRPRQVTSEGNNFAPDWSGYPP
jgi:TolB protein